MLCVSLHLLYFYTKELPSLLPTTEVIAALLHVSNSLDMIKKVLLNSPWSVSEGETLLTANQYLCLMLSHGV